MIHRLTTAEVVAALNSLTEDDMARARASLARGDSQDRGDAARLAAGIDGTAGDAQDDTA